MLDHSPAIEPQTPVRVLPGVASRVVSWRWEDEQFRCDERKDAVTAFGCRPIMVDLVVPFSSGAAQHVYLETPSLDVAEELDPPASTYMRHCACVVLLLPYDRPVGNREKAFLEEWVASPRPIAVIIAGADKLSSADPATFRGRGASGALADRVIATRKQLVEAGSKNDAARAFIDQAMVAAVSVVEASEYWPTLKSIREFIAESVKHFTVGSEHAAKRPV